MLVSGREPPGEGRSSAPAWFSPVTLEGVLSDVRGCASARKSFDCNTDSALHMRVFQWNERACWRAGKFFLLQGTVGVRGAFSPCGAFSGMSERCWRAGKFFLLQGTVGVRGAFSPCGAFSGMSERCWRAGKFFLLQGTVGVRGAFSPCGAFRVVGPAWVW